eukprot:CAMPEP_0118930028 /NCGR_PEP_ID=MMETSP1169-20130426/6853_1 /TAXON_ID=36882 /ORGANISM="Pyramimonas obovata, Strain CCMP722" /LENGTH=307 /DNA_ID=CAMNT_0006872321 /DNA_START=222 /DNA_END=1142 /DNA_ORIENTATION=-
MSTRLGGYNSMLRGRLHGDLKDNHVDSILNSFKSHLSEVDAVLKKMDAEDAALKRKNRFNSDFDAFVLRHDINIGTPRPPVPPSKTRQKEGFRRGGAGVGLKEDPPRPKADIPTAIPSSSEPLRPLRRHKKTALRHSVPSMYSSTPHSADEDPLLEPIQQDRHKRSAYSNLNLRGFRSRAGSARGSQRPSSSRPARVSQMDPDWWKAAYKQDSLKYQKAREAEHEQLEAEFQQRQQAAREERKRDEERRRAEAEEARKLYEEARQKNERKRKEERDRDRRAEDDRAWRKLDEDRARKRAEEARKLYE